jgi:hypothetical protein
MSEIGLMSSQSETETREITNADLIENFIDSDDFDNKVCHY